MKAYQYDKSFALYDRAEKVVPCGLYGHLGVGRARLNPMGCYPLFAERAEGTYIWDADGNFVEENTLSVNVSRLRKKLGGDSIRTIQGMGYLWEDKI